MLYQNMMRIWRNLFTPASLFGFTATVLFTIAVLHVTRWGIGLSVVVALIAIWWIHRSRPILGSED
ncbi:hypothetical protein [Streptomyces sp. NPDC046939]|uniref:hypothetical protein n=1 Tax=Streptomyces sp. NPDC046939 TaxID=3155376 RepID=UPI0033DEE943